MQKRQTEERIGGGTGGEHGGSTIPSFLGAIVIGMNRNN
jgi:hypothetical protein